MLETLNKSASLPLTLAQLDFWEEFTFHPDKPVSTVAHLIEFTGDVNEPALAAAITQMTKEADIMSVRFRRPPGEDTPVQYVDPNLAPELVQIDLRAHDTPEAEARSRMQADIEAQLDLHDHPISAQWLIRLEDTRWYWYTRSHHIIVDGFSMSLMEQRCAALYRHYQGQSEFGASLSPLKDYIEEEATYQSGPRFEKDRAYWRDYLSTGVDLPILQKGGDSYGDEGFHSDAMLSSDISQKLRNYEAELDMGWPDLLVMLCGAYLFQSFPRQQLAGDTVLPIWLPYMSRMGSVSANIPALVVNILPLQLTVGADETLRGFLKRTEKTLRKQRRHGRFRIEQLAADYGVQKGSRFYFSPLINVLPFDPPVFEGCNIDREVLAAGPGDGFNITIAGRRNAEELLLNLDADPEFISAEDFEKHKNGLMAFLEKSLVPESLTKTI